MSCISAPAQWRASMARKAAFGSSGTCVGVVRGDAGGADLLQEDRFQVDEMMNEPVM